MVSGSGTVVQWYSGTVVQWYMDERAQEQHRNNTEQNKSDVPSELLEMRINLLRSNVVVPLPTSKTIFSKSFVMSRLLS